MPHMNEVFTSYTGCILKLITFSKVKQNLILLNLVGFSSHHNVMLLSEHTSIEIIRSTGSSTTLYFPAS